MEENRFFEMKKWLPVPVVVMMLLSGLYVAFLIGGPAQGAPSLGTITVSGGNTRSFTGVDYILDGNITVTGSGSRLTFVNCNLTISQDVGMDGIFGGSDDHVYSILVQSGGYLEFKNSKITTQTDQLHPYFMMDIDANGSGSRILFDNVIMEGPGEITASSGARIDALGSVFMELEDKDDLAYDIDGDGGTEDDEDYNNDGPLFTYRSGAQGLIVNSQIRDTFSFSTSSRDGRIAGNMTLDGTGTNVTIINSFLDVDFETNRSTGTHNMLKVSNGAVAHLVGVALNVSASDPTHPAIFVEDTGSKAVYYRWIATHVLDGMDIQVEDQSVTIYRIEGNTNSRLTSSYLTSDIRNFMERTPLTWNQTGPDGWSFIPVITDVIRPSTMPNSDAYPDFRVQVIQGTETVSTHTSFNNYPKVPDQDEARYLLEAIKDGSADQTHAFSDLEGPMEFDRYVVTPSSSSYFSGSDVDLTLNSAVTLTGTSAIIDGTFYPSYYAFDGHLIIRSGGDLVINDTAVRFLTDDSPAYILIENGGKLEMNNVTLSSTGGNPLYVYLMGSSGPELTLNEGSIKVNSLVARDTAIMDLKGEHMNGSINLHGSNVDVSIMSDTITSPSVYARDCTLKMGGGMVAIEDLDWSGVSFSSEDAVFSTVLDVDRSASLTNVTYSGNLPDERTNWLKALGSGVIQRSWWVNAQVQDSVQNPVVGATIYVQRIVGPLHIDISTHITAENGTVMFPVVQEEIRSTGRTYLGNYRLNASYMGINSPPLSAVVSGTDVDAIVILPGGPNIVPDMVWVEGTMIDGFPVIINGSFINDGEFATDPFTASILVNGESIGEGDLPGLAPGASSMISATWTCIEGDVIISLSADINDEVTETDEDDNVLDDPNTIGIGPDYMVDLDIPPVEWAYNTSGQFKIVVSNEGEQDPEENSFYVNITWDDQDGGGIIETFIMFDYIPPGEIVKRTINWTPSAVGSVNLIASIVSKYDRSPINSIDMMNINVLSLPDIHLVMSSFSVDSPDPVTVNTTVMVLFSIENTGDLPASPFIVSLYDGEISEEAKVDLDASVPGLAPGEELEMEFIWFAGLPIGLHDLIVSIDALNSVKEQDEMNNVVIFPVRIDTPPDLTFTTNIGVSPQIVTEGKNATFWATVKNNGNTMARNAKVQFALDSDTNVIEMIEIDLLPGQERNISIIWTAVRTAEETGFRTMFIVADPVDSILEPNEENNLRSIDIKVISRPDLYMGPNDLYVSEQYDIDIGDEVAISATIRNSGETPAKDIFIRFYDGDPLEGGKIISWKETQPSISIRSLPAGGFRWANITWTPTSGGYHDIYVVLDLIDAIKESNEENNKVFWQVYVQTLPDMELTNISLYQGEFNVNSAGVGSILTINTTVENTGDTTSPTFRVRFFNADFVNDPDPVPIGMGMTYLAGTLPGRSSMNVEMPWTVGYPKGFRTVIVEVELLEGEEQTSSNNRIVYQVEVYDKDDVPELLLVNSSLSVSTGYTGVDVDLGYDPIAYFGMNLSMELNLTNDGGLAASNTTVMFVASNSTDSWVELVVNIPFLENNGTDILRGFWNLKSLGMNKMRIIVDPENNIREFDEANNVLTFNVEVVEAPDISIELVAEGDAYNAVSGQFDMREDNEYEITFRVVNNGNFTFNGLDIEFNDLFSLVGGESSTRTMDLIPYQERLVTYRVKPHGVVGDTKVFKCSVDEGGRFYESNTGNNEASAIILIKEGDQPGNLWIWILVILLILIAIGGGVGYFVYTKMKNKDMAKCSNCGGLVQMDADMCPHCGVEFSEELECECGELIPPGATECPSCHRPVTGDAGPSKDEGSEEEETDEELEELEEEGEEIEEAEEEEIISDAEETIDEIASPAGGEEEELAECFECGALIPVSAPICPHCGAVFE